MSEFIEECRREWKRLGVPDPIANEMAADLKADLDEAEVEGGSAEDVLGNSAFDPRRFAAAWAGARGVTRPVTVDAPPVWRQAIALALTIVLGALTLVAGVALLVAKHGGSFGAATGKMFVGPGPIFPPGSKRLELPPALGQFVAPEFAGNGIRPLALLVLIIGIMGLILLFAIRRSPWWGTRRQS